MNSKTPSDFQREMMSHVNRMRLKIDGDKTIEVEFKLWFDNQEYASTFMTLIKLKIITLEADYSHKSIDEWLLENLKFKQDGKIVQLKQMFSSEMTKEFIRGLIDEIKRFQ